MSIRDLSDIKIFKIALLIFLLVGCRKDGNLLHDKPIVGLPPSGYKLLWSDEFNTAYLDSTKWSYRALGARRDAYNSKESITIDTSNQHLVINTFLRNDSVFTGMIGTMNKFETEFGYFEASIMVEDIFSNYWGAFWLQSRDFGKTLNPQADGMEIDIMEFFAGDPYTVHHYLHWNGYGANHQFASSFTQSQASYNDGKFHKYSLEWTPEYYRFYVDDRLVWTYNAVVSKAKQYIILSTEVSNKEIFKTLNRPSTKFIVDYVRVYKNQA